MSRPATALIPALALRSLWRAEAPDWWKAFSRRRSSRRFWRRANLQAPVNSNLAHSPEVDSAAFSSAGKGDSYHRWRWGNSARNSAAAADSAAMNPAPRARRARPRSKWQGRTPAGQDAPPRERANCRSMHAPSGSYRLRLIAEPARPAGMLESCGWLEIEAVRKLTRLPGSRQFARGAVRVPRLGGAGDGAEAVAEPRLDHLGGAGGWGKAVAVRLDVPPHSKSSWRLTGRARRRSFVAALLWMTAKGGWSVGRLG